ncbi:hypothetical protein SAMN06296386_103213 [Lachnospiraceae bacterium]|nr:hypothetical protein SAMN06296386_103213 [Lachnospiraceae bacterium]
MYLRNFLDNKLIEGVLKIGGVLVAVVGFLISLYLWHSSFFTVYELFLSLFSSAVLFYFALNMKNGTDKIDILLKAICAIAVGVSAYSILTFGQTFVHSDVATATLLAQSQLRTHSLFPATWNYVNGDVWVIAINLFTLPFTAFMKDQPLARELGSLVFVLVTVFFIYLFNRFYLQSKAWLFSIPFFLLFLSGSLDFTLYQAAYTGQMIWLLLSVWFSYEMMYGKRKGRAFVFYSVVSFLTILGGMRAVAVQTLPIIAAMGACLCLKYYRVEEKSIDIKSIVSNGMKNLLLIFPSSIVGIIGYKMICSTHTIQTGRSRLAIVRSVRQMIRLVIAYLDGLFGCFGYTSFGMVISEYGLRNIVTISSTVILIFIIPILQFKNWKKENDKIHFLLLFTVFHAVEMFILFVFFDKSEPRYLLTTIFLLLIISARYIYEYWIKNLFHQKKLVIALYSFAVLIFVVSLTYSNREWKNNLAEKKALSQALVDRGLTKGYAGSYWDAYNNEVYSDLKLKVGAVSLGTKGAMPYRWLVDDKAFEPIDGIKSFLIIKKKDNPLISSKLEQFFGHTTDHFVVKSYHIYVWDYDISEKFVDDVGEIIVNVE